MHYRNNTALKLPQLSMHPFIHTILNSRAELIALFSFQLPGSDCGIDFLLLCYLPPDQENYQCCQGTHQSSL